MLSALGFNEPLEDGEEPYEPNRAERRAAKRQYLREAKAANKAYQKKVEDRRRRRPVMQALQHAIDADGGKDPK